MSEKHTFHPNQTPRGHHPRRRVGALMLTGALAGSAVAVAGSRALGDIRESNRLYRQLTRPDALDLYNNGRIDPTKVVVVKADKSSTAWEFAQSLEPTVGDIRELVDPIAVQAGPNGVQPGETFVVSRNMIPEQQDTSAKQH